jgi:electron-transferring-flavoprotein dehydrogenase
VAVGFVTGLGYTNPYLSPFEEFQRWKTHPNIRYYLENDKGEVTAKRLSYGARAINASGLNCPAQDRVPRRRAGGLRRGLPECQPHQGQPRRHQDRHAGREAAYEAVAAGRQHDELSAYPEAFEESWLYTELNKDRNFKNWFKYGLTTATLMNGFEQFVLRGHIPWTLHRDKPDHQYLKPAPSASPSSTPSPTAS